MRFTNVFRRLSGGQRAVYGTLGLRIILGRWLTSRAKQRRRVQVPHFIRVLRHTDSKWAADMSDLPPACKAEREPLKTPEDVTTRIAEIPTRLGLSSECDRQLIQAAASKLVAEHRDEILEYLNRP